MENTETSTKTSFLLQVLRPEGKAFDGEVKVVAFPAFDGEVAVLANHAPFLCAMGKGLLQITDDKSKNHYFFVEGGIAEVNDNKMCFLADYITPIGEIDRESVENELKNTMQRNIDSSYTSQDKQYDVEKYQLMLKALEKAQ